MAFELVAQFLEARESFIDIRSVRRSEVDDRLADDAAHA